MVLSPSRERLIQWFSTIGSWQLYYCYSTTEHGLMKQNGYFRVNFGHF